MDIKKLSILALGASQVLLVLATLCPRYTTKTKTEEFIFVGYGVGFKLTLTQIYGTAGSVIDSKINSINKEGDGSESEFMLLEQHLQQSVKDITDRKSVIDEIRYINQLCKLGISIKE